MHGLSAEAVQIELRPEGALERVALWLNLGPLPIAQAFYQMMGARAAMAGERLGIYRELARQDASGADLAERLALAPQGCLRLLESLEALRLVVRRGPRFALAPRARRWLDPASDRYVGDFLEFNYAQWEWWSSLEDVVRTGKGTRIHDYPPEDPRWRSYIRAMFQLARLSAPEVARAIQLPAGASRLLDLGGAHGWFSAELCRRHPGLSATVVDLPGSLEAGRALLAEHARGVPVDFREGDALESSLGGPFDAALCFQLLHHFERPHRQRILQRLREALHPGGVLAVLEYLVPEPRRASQGEGLIGLHYFLTSGASSFPLSELHEDMRTAGLKPVRHVRTRRIPLQTLVLARRAS